MTKGKYAARAAVRREAQEVEASEAAYRRQIVRLTEERDTARAERDAARVAWRKEVRVLAAQLAEAVSPRVEALNHELERYRASNTALKAQAAEDDRHLARAHARVSAYLAKLHSLSADDALGMAQELMLLSTRVVPHGEIEKRFADRHGLEALERVNRVTNRHSTVGTARLKTTAVGADEAMAAIDDLGTGRED